MFVPKEEPVSKFAVGDVVELVEFARVNSSMGTWIYPHSFRVRDIDGDYLTVEDVEDESKVVTILSGARSDLFRLSRDLKVVK